MNTSEMYVIDCLPVVRNLPGFQDHEWDLESYRNKRLEEYISESPFSELEWLANGLGLQALLEARKQARVAIDNYVPLEAPPEAVTHGIYISGEVFDLNQEVLGKLSDELYEKDRELQWGILSALGKRYSKA